MDSALLDSLLDEARERQALPAPPLRRLLRERAGLSQAQIATVLGVTRPTVTRYEMGTRNPRGTSGDYLSLLRRLASEPRDQHLSTNDREDGSKEVNPEPSPHP